MGYLSNKSQPLAMHHPASPVSKEEELIYRNNGEQPSEAALGVRGD
jgi:hypothetical protein